MDIFVVHYIELWCLVPLSTISCVVWSYVFLWLHVLFDLMCFCGFMCCLVLCVFLASCVVWSYVFLWLQTIDEATKTHKIKQHMKPQKHIRSNNRWSHNLQCCVASCVVWSYVFLWLHVLFDLMCFCGFIYCLILCVFVASCVVWSYVFLWHMKPHNTEDQTTHEATKTLKIKQRVVWSYVFLWLHVLLWLHLLFYHMCFCGFMCCLIFSVVWLHVLFDLMYIRSNNTWTHKNT
jgi:hypothetical protein